MQNNESSREEFLKRKYTILDLLNHEVNVTIGSDRVLKRIEKVITSPDVLKQLSFEQIMQYMDKIMRRQNESHAFIIDFYRVTSKSPEVQSTLKQYTLGGVAENQSGEAVNTEDQASVKQMLLTKLAGLIKEEEEERANAKG